MSARSPHRRLAGLILFGLLLGGVMLAGRGNNRAEAIVEAIRDIGQLPFFAGMTLLPLIGFPVTPFYLLGGAVFGEWHALLATAISLATNLVLSYAIAHRWMRRQLTDLLARRGRSLPDARKRNVWLYAAAIRLAPGPSLCVKNYLVALANVPLKPYLIISWPIGMGYAAGLIIVGDSLIDRRGIGLAVGALILIMLGSLLAFLRIRIRSRQIVDV